MRVGTRCVDPIIKNCAKDHPHACGDKMCFKNSFAIAPGSSPCVWGQGIKFPLSSLQIRIIPMRVGTREYNVCNVVPSRDHPHACGDKNTSVNRIDVFIGSSPCVWGQEQAIKRLLDSVRIIPMRVGTSTASYG